jgi:hypothetical protein
MLAERRAFEFLRERCGLDLVEELEEGALSSFGNRARLALLWTMAFRIYRSPKISTAII